MPSSTSLLDEVAAFERTLTDDGAIILKFWMHLGKAAQKKRFKAWEKDPLRRWRVGKDSWRHWRMFDKFVTAADRAIRRTSTDQAPWQIVEGEDDRYRSVAVGTALRDAIRRGLERVPVHRAHGRVARVGVRPRDSVLHSSASSATSTCSIAWI